MTIARAWLLEQPAGPMTCVRPAIARAMEEAFREGNASPHQSQRASHAAKMQSEEARLVEGRQRLTTLRLCAVVALHPGQATTAATACLLDLCAGLITSVYPVQAIATGVDMVSKEAFVPDAQDVPPERDRS
eukprot:jgi/Picsp_1/1271/NSC_04752-R1_---NA---